MLLWTSLKRLYPKKVQEHTLELGHLAAHSHGRADVHAVDGVAGRRLFLGVLPVSLCGSLGFCLWGCLQHEVKAVSLRDLLRLNVKVAVLFATELAVQRNKFGKRI